MRIGVVYSHSPKWPKMVWVCQAIERLGHECVHIHDRSALAAADRGCDLILFQHKAVIRWPNLRQVCGQRKAPWVQWWFDLLLREPWLKLTEQVAFAEYRELMSHMDAVFVKEAEMLDAYRACGINAFYLDQGFPSHIPEVVQARPPKWDVLLWGQPYKLRRQHVHDLVRHGVKVAWATESGDLPAKVHRLPWCHPEHLWEIAGQARFVLSIDWTSGVPGYTSDRFWLACGMGCSVIHQGHSWHSGPVATYKTVPELLDRLKRRTNGKELRQWVMAEHTIEHRLQTMLACLKHHGILAATVTEPDSSLHAPRAEQRNDDVSAGGEGT